MAERVRALFVGINYRYINPTFALLPGALAKSCALHFYGPGYLPDDVLARGIERYAEAIGGVDLIIATKDFCASFDAARLDRFVARYVVRFGNARVGEKMLDDIGTFLRRNRARVLASLLDSDPHSVQQQTLDSYTGHASYFLCWGPGFVNTLGDPDALSREHYMRKKQERGLTVGLFDEFIRQNHSHIVNLGHFISESEFHWGSLSNREFDVTVPGARYARRKDTQDRLSRAGGIRIAKSRYQLLYQLAERLRMRPLTNFYLSHLYNLGFQRMLSRSKMCVTDGGMNNFPVRKFFEIPAAGALLICWPATGMDALGFRNDVNCIHVRDDADVVCVVRAVAENPAQYEHIAAAGRDLVALQHSSTARAIQLGEAIQHIRAGTFRGSRWEAGQFVCDA